MYCVRKVPPRKTQQSGNYSHMKHNISRNLLTISITDFREKLKHIGVYVLCEDAGFNVVLSGSGQEVDLCLKTKVLLNEKGVKCRVVSFPSWELFEDQVYNFSMMEME